MHEVINGHRPQIPLECPAALKNLIHSCLQQKYWARPTFRAILEYLKGMGDRDSALPFKHWDHAQDFCELLQVAHVLVTVGALALMLSSVSLVSCEVIVLLYCNSCVQVQIT